MSEILKVKVSDTHTLIAYNKSQSIPRQDHRPSGKSSHEVAFKVGPMDSGLFVECSPEAASVLLAMLALPKTTTAAVPSHDAAEAQGGIAPPS
jgi:hypothetical protein